MKTFKEGLKFGFGYVAGIGVFGVLLTLGKTGFKYVTENFDINIIKKDDAE